ncbi:MAG: hypothetical protein MUF58_03355 [Arcicella sp.]|jgi:hypothetical protein|nr:hypothetical protein [Arcicella sp.]
MKNLKLKHLAFALTIVLQWSCATTDIPEARTEIPKTDLFGEGSVLNEYKNFKIDGIITNDSKKIEAMMNNAHVVFYNPEIKEVDFYSTEASYRKFNPEIEEDTKVNESVQATAATSYPDTFTDLGTFGTATAGVSGLGTILDQGYFRNYAKNVYFFTTNSTAVNFVRCVNQNNFDTEIPSVQLSKSSGGVIKNDHSMSIMLGNIKAGTTVARIINDTQGTRYIRFFKNTGAVSTDQRVTIQVNADSRYLIASNFLSSIGGTAKSFSVSSN